MPKDNFDGKYNKDYILLKELREFRARRGMELYEASQRPQEGRGEVLAK